MPVIARYLLSVAAYLACASLLSAQEKHKSYEDARHEGVRLLNSQRLAEAQAPLEAALKLAPDDKARLEIYQGLMRVYRLLPEIDKKIEANEFVIRHTQRRPGRSIASRDLVSFLYERGKLDVAIERYEAHLKREPQDVAALSVLTDIYKRVQRDAGKADEYGQKLEAVNRKIAREAAQELENAAAASPPASAALLKDAAQLWLEAGEKAKAVAAAKRSADGPPETRSDLLAFYWHDGLGDVFLATAEPKLAVVQFERALGMTKLESHRQATQKKLASAKEAAALQ
jgi:tetratricopeptide (TPR) repeat protein